MTQLFMASQVETSFEQEATTETSEIQYENTEVDFFEKKHMRMVAKSKSPDSLSLRRK